MLVALLDSFRASLGANTMATVVGFRLLFHQPDVTVSQTPGGPDFPCPRCSLKSFPELSVQGMEEHRVQAHRAYHSCLQAPLVRPGPLRED